MLEAEDLFKGAWVWFKTNNKSAQITENYMLLDGSGKRMVSLDANGERYCVPIEEVEPFEVSIGILLKNEFIEFDPQKVISKDSDIYYICEDDSFSIEVQLIKHHYITNDNKEQYEEFWRLEIDGPGGHFETTREKIFVHELQYALKFCKVKKNIIV